MQKKESVDLIMDNEFCSNREWLSEMFGFTMVFQVNCSSPLMQEKENVDLMMFNEFCSNVE